MRKSEIEAVGELAGEALSAAGGLIGELHDGIASRPFGILGQAAAPVRVLHDGISRAVYGGVRAGLRGAVAGGAALAARHAREDGPSLHARPIAAFALAAVNGFYGDRLTTRGSELAVGMDVRRAGEPVALRAPDVMAAFPNARSRVAVFVHGLCETEAAWWLPPRGVEVADRTPFGARLESELGYSAVYVRYNTGCRVSDNGRSLAALLDELSRVWPVAVEELVLVGHSMGGLVARSACHYGEAEGRRFTAAVHHVFCLGTPHLGADLEKGASVATWALRRLPETRPLATVLAARSVGIKDLRYGSCVEEDWCDCEDPDEFLRDRCREVPFLPDAHYYFIGSTLRGSLGRALGDLLVRMPSASGRGNGRGRKIPFAVDHGLELSGLTHFDLLGHPDVYRQIHAWLAAAAAGAPAAA